MELKLIKVSPRLISASKKLHWVIFHWIWIFTHYAQLFAPKIVRLITFIKISDKKQNCWTPYGNFSRQIHEMNCHNTLCPLDTK